MKATVTPVVICALGTNPKGLIHVQENVEIRGQLETIQTTALLRLSRILRKLLETWGDCCHWNSSERLSASAGVKNSQRVTK